jgi:hypothetical protein
MDSRNINNHTHNSTDNLNTNSSMLAISKTPCLVNNQWHYIARPA